MCSSPLGTFPPAAPISITNCTRFFSATRLCAKAERAGNSVTAHPVHHPKYEVAYDENPLLEVDTSADERQYTALHAVVANGAMLVLIRTAPLLRGSPADLSAWLPDRDRV